MADLGRRVVAFLDRLATRGFSEWAALAGDQVHAHPYVNSGFLGLPHASDGDPRPKL